MTDRAADYGDRFADVYDEFFGSLDSNGAVDAIVGLANRGLVLELGIGTGRVALPLSARGARVHGIDASEKMVARMRSKPGSDAIAVTIGDFANFVMPERFSVVFVAFNTFFALSTQDAQMKCFRTVAAHLAPGGVFAIEAFVPDPSRFDRGQSFRTLEVAAERVIVEASMHDAKAQRVRSSFIVMKPNGNEIYPLEIRYAWPSELDAMAVSAGMRLRDRWSDWRGTAFTGRSIQHVSLYTSLG